MTFCSEKLGHPCSSPARRIEGACLNYSYYTKASAILSASPDVSGSAIRFEEDDGLVWKGTGNEGHESVEWILKSHILGLIRTLLYPGTSTSTIFLHYYGLWIHLTRKTKQTSRKLASVVAWGLLRVLLLVVVMVFVRALNPNLM